MIYQLFRYTYALLQKIEIMALFFDDLFTLQ